jgi:hypothetical protein
MMTSLNRCQSLSIETPAGKPDFGTDFVSQPFEVKREARGVSFFQLMVGFAVPLFPLGQLRFVMYRRASVVGGRLDSTPSLGARGSVKVLCRTECFHGFPIRTGSESFLDRPTEGAEFFVDLRISHDEQDQDSRVSATDCSVSVPISELFLASQIAPGGKLEERHERCHSNP